MTCWNSVVSCLCLDQFVPSYITNRTLSTIAMWQGWPLIKSSLPDYVVVYPRYNEAVRPKKTLFSWHSHSVPTQSYFDHETTNDARTLLQRIGHRARLWNKKVKQKNYTHTPKNKSWRLHHFLNSYKPTVCWLYFDFLIICYVGYLLFLKVIGFLKILSVVKCMSSCWKWP